MLGSSNLVIRRVFEGGAGCDSGGIEDRSSDMGECARLAARAEGDEAEDSGGDSVALECATEGGGWDETSAMFGSCVEARRTGTWSDL